jgi:hypothetical protein
MFLTSSSDLDAPSHLPTRLSFRKLLPASSVEAAGHLAATRNPADQLALGGGNGESHVDPLDGRPCVYTGWVFGHAGMLHSRAEYCWVKGRWVVERSERQEDNVLIPGDEPV